MDAPNAKQAVSLVSAGERHSRERPYMDVGAGLYVKQEAERKASPGRPRKDKSMSAVLGGWRY